MRYNAGLKMMSDAVLQILLILAYLAIGLITVTIPIFAICVTYLRQEKTEARKERKQQIDVVKKQIVQQTKELSGEKKDSDRFKEIEGRIKNHYAQLKGLELRVKFLTAKGAVRDPIISLIIALSLAIIGIAFLHAGFEQYLFFIATCILGSAISSGIALYYLYETVSAVEYAALRPARIVQFKACFESFEPRKKIKLGKGEDVSIGVGTKEEDVENLEIRVYLPPEIELKKSDGRAILQPDAFDFPYYTLVIFEKNLLYRNVWAGPELFVVAKKIGEYKVPVHVCAKGIYEYKTELVLDVVE